MCRHRDRKRESAAEAFVDERGRNKILSEASVLFGNGNSQKTLFAGFFQERGHEAGFEFLYTVDYGQHIVGKKGSAHLFYHLLLLVVFFRDESFLWLALTDEPLSSFDGFR